MQMVKNKSTVLSSLLSVIRPASLKHIYSSPGIYYVSLHYNDVVLPLATSVVVMEESLKDLQLAGPTLVSFDR